MSLHETKYCPRCKAAFECKPANISQCQCYGLLLSIKAQEYIQEQYDTCLCRNCLEELGQKIKSED